MELFEISLSGEPGIAIVAIVAFAAGLIRGFTGFGGPAFVIAILTLFFTPYSVVSKVLIVDFFASMYLFKAVYRDIDWKSTAWLVIPTVLLMPVGHWLLIELDPGLMKRAMAAVITLACILLLLGLRYRSPMSPVWLVIVGVIAGIVFGGSYIALVAVVAILLGPYDKHQGRTLIISWSFCVVIAFASMSALAGTTTVDDVITAAPGAATYLLGTWLGSLGFGKASESLFRRSAIATLLALSVFNIVG